MRAASALTPVPTHHDAPRDGRDPDSSAGPQTHAHGELAARRPGLDDPHDDRDPLVASGPNPPDPHGHRAAHLARSADAVGPAEIDDYLAARPPRRSGLSYRADVREYHRDRARTRGHEALTPGADLLVPLLPLSRAAGGRHALAPGHFATTSAEILYSASYGPVEKYVWTYLFDHRCFKTFERTGVAVVTTVRQPDLAACAGVCTGTIAEAIHKLIAKGRLTRKLRGQGLPPHYTLAPIESGASVYPAGHNRSARKRLLALLKCAVQRPDGDAARTLAEALGLPLGDLRRRDLATLLWRRLARAAQDAVCSASGPGPCPHAVDSDDPDSGYLGVQSPAPHGDPPPHGGSKS